MKGRLPVRPVCLFLLLPSLAWGAPQDCGGPALVELKPIMKTRRTPKDARPQGIKSLRLEIWVTPSGAPGDVHVLISSGNASWDQVWMLHVKREWRWQPMPECTRPVTTILQVVS